MGLIFNLSLRNLLRQKRRNMLLGIGISFGMMILVIANSFSHGMVDVLIKDVVSHAFGHLVVEGRVGNSSYAMMFRDKARIEKIIKETIPAKEIVTVDESLGAFGRAIGNGEADNIVVVGVSVKSDHDKKAFFKNFFTLVDGNFDEYFSKNIEYPAIISVDKAKSLNVKVHDVIKVRIPMVTGQMQAAQLTVIAIANANNTFMNLIAFVDGDRVKKLVGYKPWESANLQITLKNPKQTAKLYADLLHKKLQPEVLSIVGKVDHQECQIFAFKNGDASKKVINQSIRIMAGDPKKAFDKEGVMVSKQLAGKLNLGVGSEFSYDYLTKFRGPYQEKFKVDAIYDSSTKLGNDVILMNGERIFDTYDKFLPKQRNPEYFEKDDAIYPALATEWKLFDRSKDSQGLQKKYKEDRKIRTKQSKIDVVTMYEGADFILKLESALNMITLIAVLILFFIILIGVINTLRMTVRERTREIGTVRAIGMQKNDVRNMFIIETLQLTAISCFAGIILGVIVMSILGAITFNSSSALSMILKDKHLNFMMDPLSILFNFLLIMFISGVTAYFPARRAAKLSAVEALRHYE